MKKILVTGGAGFIGSNFVHHILNESDFSVVNLDALTYAGSLANLDGVEKFGKRYEFVKGDICNANLVEQIFETHGITDVIHFAAESHVDNSIKNPAIFTKTNVVGTQLLLDAARKAWMSAPFVFKDGCEANRFHHISTDEVYGTLGETGLFSESTPYAPNSPYSASKAGSDFVVRAYHETFGLNAVITNCSNNYGPRQHGEKFIPTIIRSCLAGVKIPVYGDGKNIRDWLYVEDHCHGIRLAFLVGESGESYNIGGRNERTNLQIVSKICEILDSLRPRGGGRRYAELLSFVEDRAGHDRRYAIDASKIEERLGWRAQENFESGIVKTVEWYLRRAEN